MTEYRQIVYEKKGFVARLKMNRPRYRNAQSRVLLEELDRGFAEAAADEEKNQGNPVSNEIR